MKPSQKIIEKVRKMALERTKPMDGSPAVVYQETYADYINAIIEFIDEQYESTLS